MSRLQNNYVLGIIVGILSGLLYTGSWADTVFLKSGRTITGKILQEDDASVKIDFMDVELTFYRDEIEKIERGDGVGVESRKQPSPSPAVKQINQPTIKALAVQKTSYRIKKQFSFRALADVLSFSFSYPVPRDDIPGQRVYDIKVLPVTASFKDDSEGYRIASFTFWNVKQDTEINIEISYSIEISDTLGTINPAAVPILSEELKNQLSKYLKSENHAPSDMQDFVATVGAISKGNNNPYFIARSIYDYLIEQIKYEDKPENSPVQAPSETFINQKGNCVDIALLFVDLARAGGVPARLVSGFVFQGNEPSAQFSGTQGHTWAEIYLTGYGWVPVDPTFGIRQQDANFCFPYRKHIREFYGQFFLRDSGSMYRGSVEIRGWPLQNMNRSPMTQQDSFVIEPLQSVTDR